MSAQQVGSSPKRCLEVVIGGPSNVAYLCFKRLTQFHLPTRTPSSSAWTSDDDDWAGTINPEAHSFLRVRREKVNARLFASQPGSRRTRPDVLKVCFRECYYEKQNLGAFAGADSSSGSSRQNGSSPSARTEPRSFTTSGPCIRRSHVCNVRDTSSTVTGSKAFPSAQRKCLNRRSKTFSQTSRWIFRTLQIFYRRESADPLNFCSD